MIVGLLEVVSIQGKNRFFHLAGHWEDDGENTEERAKILQRINDNKIARNQRGGHIDIGIEVWYYIAKKLMMWDPHCGWNRRRSLRAAEFFEDSRRKYHLRETKKSLQENTN